MKRKGRLEERVRLPFDGGSGGEKAQCSMTTHLQVSEWKFSIGLAWLAMIHDRSGHVR